MRYFTDASAADSDRNNVEGYREVARDLAHLLSKMLQDEFGDQVGEDIEKSDYGLLASIHGWDTPYRSEDEPVRTVAVRLGETSPVSVPVVIVEVARSLDAAWACEQAWSRVAAVRRQIGRRLNDASSSAPALASLIESVATYWQIHGEELRSTIDVEDSLLIDALVRALTDLNKVSDEKKPRGPLGAILGFLADRFADFSTEAATSAGKVAGPLMIVGAGVTVARVTGTWEEVAELVRRAREVVGQ